MKHDFDNPEKQPAVTLLQFEPDEYRYLMDEFEMSDEEKDEFLRVLWHILSTFVDIGFGVDSVQLAAPELLDFSGNDEIEGLTESERVRSFNKMAAK